MKQLFTFLLMVMLAVVLKPQTAEASHMAGADLTYTAVPGQPLTYLVRLKLYRDCLGITLGNTASICYSSNICGFANTVIAPEVAVNIVPSNECVTTTPTCPGNIGDVEEHIYEIVITLPQACTDWRFSWDECCRNNAITNIQNAAGTSLYISALLNNVNAPANNSPSFNNLAYTRFCVGNAFYYDQGAIEIDGDSVVFSMAAAEGNGGACPPNPNNLTYVQPYNAQQPVGSTVPFTIDQNTGLVYFVPNTVQVGVFCIMVREYRNQILVGEVKRDIQINVVGACNPILPSFVDTVLTTAAGAIQAGCNDYQIILPFDTTFQCASAMPSDFRTISPLGIPNPCVAVQPINCQNGQTDSLLLTFLNPLTVGTTYLWVKRGFDGNTLLSECGAQMLESADTVQITVVDNSVFTRTQDTVGCVFNSVTVNLSDSIYCFSIANDGTDFTMVDGNGTVLPIANAYGYCTPNGLKARELLINMQGGQSGQNPIYLIVKNSITDNNTVANGCGRFLNVGDTIAEFYVDNFIPVTLGTDLNVCDDQPSPVLNSGYANLNFQWYFQGNVITGATDSIYAATQSGQYIVTVNSTPVCGGADTIDVVINKAPLDSLGPDVLSCSGAALPLLNAFNNGATYQWYQNGIAISGATNQTYQPATAGTYSVLVTVGGVCFGSYDKLIDNNAPDPTVAISDTAICNDGQATLDAGNPGYNYQWSNGATTQSINVNQANTYYVTVSKDGCVGTDSVSVDVQTYPGVPVIACQAEENGQYKFIYTWSSLDPNFSYEVSEDNGQTWALANNPLTSGPSHGTNNAVPYFVVRAVSPGICRFGGASDPAACPVIIPNIFTPNNDTKNEFFEIKNIEQYPKNTLQIFNRWGKEVFSASPYNNDSEKFDGKDLPDGVYFYVLNLGDGITEPKSGTVTINR
jgi:gliding motility-associated-like protein